MLMAVTGAFLTYEVVARYFYKAHDVGCRNSQLYPDLGMFAGDGVGADFRQHITVNAPTSLLPRTVQKLCVALSLVAILVFHWW